MTRSRLRGWHAACCSLAGMVFCSTATLAAEPDATTPSSATLQAQVQKLQEELDAMKAREAARDNAAANTTTNDKANGPAASSTSIEAVRADADTHSIAFGDMEGMGAGYVPGTGFVIKSDDGNFLLHPWAYLQARYSANYREKSKNFNTDSSTDAGFEIARLKFVMDGNVFTPDLTYQLIWNTVKAGGTLTLNDAWARYRFHDTPFAIQGGQIRNPLDHEQILFATQSLTVDRSFIDDEFAGGEGIVQGVDLSYGYDQNGPIRGEIAFTHGLRNNDVTFQGYPTTAANWGISGRVDWKLMGDWNNYNRFTALDLKKDLLVIGAGADYTEAGSTASLTHVVDAQYDMGNGFSAYAAYLGRYTKDNAGPIGTNGASTTTATHPDTYDSTARLMLAYLYNQHLEPFIRFEYIQFDPAELTPGTERGGNIDDITLGANYYFYGQRAKLSTNLIYLPNGSPVSDTSVNDILATPFQKNELIFQMQFQLII
jgi:hypothetical protein